MITFQRWLPAGKSRGHSNIAPARPGDCPACNVTLTPTIRRGLPGRIGRWVMVALFALCGCGVSAAEQQFGRLFTTGEQRQRLQELREDNRRATYERDTGAGRARGAGEARQSGPAQPGTSGVAEQGEEGLPVITLKGLVYKKDGARMAWVGGREGAAAPDYRELEPGETHDNEAIIELPMTGKSVKLKPGQSYHLHSGAVTELEDASP